MNKKKKSKKRAFSFITVFLVLLSITIDSFAQKPNILFVFADQLRSHELDCYGNDQLITPHINRLAEEGVIFINAISIASVCGPFWGMLVSGNFPKKNDMVLTDLFLCNPTPYFAEVCKSAGYKTGYIGKWHLDGYDREGYIPPERRLGFEYCRALECTHDYFNSKYYHQDEKKSRKWEGYDAIDQTDTAYEYIFRQKENPFCLFLSWGPPHDPYKAPAEYVKRFEYKKIRLRENVNDFETAGKMLNECETEVPEAWYNWRKNGSLMMKDKKNSQIENDYRGYYAAIETLDDCFGKILDMLEKTGQLDNAIVVFTSDHGNNLGSHRQKGKQLPFEESISVPFLIRYPKKIKPSVITDALLSQVDMMPTLHSLLGISCPDVDGKDISSAAIGCDLDLQDAVLIVKSIPLSVNWIVNGNGAWRGVRTKRYMYARKSDTKKPWMLFDNVLDPFQMNNLIDDSAYTEFQEKLDKKTDELLELAGDPEEPEFFARLIHKDCNEYGVYDRWKELMPPRVEPGSPCKFFQTGIK
jgi:arylsulfatase A-like enzyme